MNGYRNTSQSVRTVVSGDQIRTEEIADRAALRSILQEYFGFDLSEVESMRIPSVPEWV